MALARLRRQGRWAARTAGWALVRARRRAGARLGGRPVLLVLGDSHAEVLDHPRVHASLADHAVVVVSVGGATVSGLENPNSRTRAMPTFRRAHRTLAPDVVVVQIGEVDTGFVIWWRAQRHGQPVEAMLAEAVERYARLLAELPGRSRTVVVSAPLPTITDDQDWGEVADARREVSATQAERTALTLEFNRRVAAECARLGVVVVDLDDDCLGEDGTVRRDLLHPDPMDHHYAPEAYLDLLLPALGRAI